MIMTDKDIAKTGAALFAKQDTGTSHCGVTIDKVGPGFAQASLMIDERMLNGYGGGHGGVIFTLGLAALGYASNTQNRKSFGQSASINFLAPAPLGARLSARAQEASRSQRSAIYDVSIAIEQGEIIALMRGTAFISKDKWIADAD
jgi:acyl-CoA thioesterase